MARDPVVETTENGLGKSEFHGWLFAENEQQRGLKFGYIYIYVCVCVRGSSQEFVVVAVPLTCDGQQSLFPAKALVTERMV